MKFKGQGCPNGDFASKALIRYQINQGTDVLGWELSREYFFSLEEATLSANRMAGLGFITDVKWPVEVYDDSLIYVPAPEEYNETN